MLLNNATVGQGALLVTKLQRKLRRLGWILAETVSQRVLESGPMKRHDIHPGPRGQSGLF